MSRRCLVTCRSTCRNYWMKPNAAARKRKSMRLPQAGPCGSGFWGSCWPARSVHPSLPIQRCAVPLVLCPPPCPSQAALPSGRISCRCSRAAAGAVPTRSPSAPCAAGRGLGAMPARPWARPTRGGPPALPAPQRPNAPRVPLPWPSTASQPHGEIESDPAVGIVARFRATLVTPHAVSR